MIPKYNGRSREFSLEEIKFIAKAVIEGEKISNLAKSYRVGHKRILKIIDFYTTHVVPRPDYKAKGFVQKTLGNKIVPYYETEAEMFKTPKYTWASLSKAEKSFYLKYEKEQQGHSPND
jgi:hypothetical protein